MPIINVKLTKGRAAEVKSSLASKITKLVAEELDVKEEWITVLFDEYDRENWASSGEIHSIKFGSGCGKDGVNNCK